MLDEAGGSTCRPTALWPKAAQVNSIFLPHAMQANLLFAAGHATPCPPPLNTSNSPKQEAANFVK